MLNQPYLDEVYEEKFAKIMRNDLCPQQQYFPNDDNGTYAVCRSFSSGLATQGLNLLLINYIKLLRLQLSSYQELLFKNNGNVTAVRKIILNTNDMFDLCK